MSEEYKHSETLFKLARLRRQLHPKYNEHIHRILTKLDESALFADDADVLDGEMMADVLLKASRLVKTHKEHFHQTPHQESKAKLGLPDVPNLKVSSLEEALEGLSETTLMTPYLMAQLVDTKGTGGLQAHIDDKEVPHGETADTVGGMRRAESTQKINDKYRDDEEVASSVRGLLHGVDRTYAQLLATNREDLPIENFTTGRIPAARLGSGTANDERVLRSTDQRWVTAPELSAAGDIHTSTITGMTFTHMNESQIRNYLRNTEPYRSMELGSIVVFRVQYRNLNAGWGAARANGYTYWTYTPSGGVAVNTDGRWGVVTRSMGGPFKRGY